MNISGNAHKVGFGATLTVSRNGEVTRVLPDEKYPTDSLAKGIGNQLRSMQGNFEFEIVIPTEQAKCADGLLRASYEIRSKAQKGMKTTTTAVYNPRGEKVTLIVKTPEVGPGGSSEYVTKVSKKDVMKRNDPELIENFEGLVNHLSQICE